MIAGAQEWHPTQRAMERFGVVMTRFDLLRFECLIREESPLAVKLANRTGHNVHLYAVRFKGLWLPVVARGHKILTVLPAKELRPFKRGLKLLAAS